MVDEIESEDEGSARAVEEVAVTTAALIQRIVVPRAWGPAQLLASAERGDLLLMSFVDMPHLLCWRLPDDQDVVVEIVADDDPRAREEPDDDGNLGLWLLPDDIDEERLRYPASWGRPSPVIDAWIDGGPVVLSFADGEHILRWKLDEDMLLSLIADDRL
ncbi:MAG: hypothetical protein IT340_16390 [Chloroflexi bacterium]|nr:hypothetical protein [Chloroflexota bacterium]